MPPIPAIACLAADREGMLYALANFSAANWYQSAVGGGEVGVGTGFGSALLFRVTSLQTGGNSTALCGVDAGTSGYLLYVNGTSNVTFTCSNGTGLVEAAKRQLVSSDVGRFMLAVVQHTGSALRQYVDRTQVGADVAVAWYTAASAAARLGSTGQGSVQGGNNAQIAAWLTWRGTPSLAQVQDLFDRTRVLGDLPTTIQGATVTHRESVRDQLRGTTVTSGQTAPATLDDTITHAAPDALGMQGSPTVVTIDTSRDGRRILGVQGFAASLLQTAAGAGIRGHTGGFYLSVPVVWDTAQMSGFRTIAVCGDGSSTGWLLQTSSTTLRAFVFGAGMATLALGSSDHMQSDLVTLNFTGTSVVLFRRRVSASVAATGGYSAPSVALPMRIGAFDVAIQPAPCALIAGVQGGDVAGGLSQAQLDQLVIDWERTGLLVPLASVTNQHSHNFDLDMIAAGETVPVQVLDRIGADHLTRKGVGVASGAVRVQGGQADFWRSAPGAGFRGSAAGTVVYWMGAIEDFTMAGAAIFAEVVSGSNAGWSLQSGNDNYSSVRFCWFDAGGGFRVSAQVALSSIVSAGQNVIIHGVWTGSYLQLYVQGTQRGADVGPYTGHATPAATEPMYLGSRAGTSFTPQNCRHAGFGAAASAPSAAQIAAHAAACLAAAKIVPFAGFDDRRFDIVQDVIDAGGSLPALSVDRAGSGDKLTRAGAPMQLAQRTERNWSYEKSPIYRGSSGYSATAFLSSDTGQCAGDPASFFTLWAFIAWPTTTSISRVIAASRDSTVAYGWQIHTTGTNGLLYATVGNEGGSDISSSPSAIASGELGKIMIAGFCVDSTVGALRAFGRRVQLSAPGMTYAFRPRAGIPMTVGKRTTDHYPAQDMTIIGGWYGKGVLSLVEYQAIYDDFAANERVRRVLPKVTNAWDVTASVRNNGGAMPTAIADLVGSVSLTVNGTLSIGDVYSRALTT